MQIFQENKRPFLSPAPSRLLSHILMRIEQEKRAEKARKHLYVFGTVFILSIAAIVPALSLLQRELIQTGFLQFASLLFSDAGSLITNWQDAALSLLETLPITSIVTVLFTTLIALWSLKHISEEIRNGMFNRKLAHA